MNTNCSPGPWVATESETTSATWVAGSDGKRICTMRPGNFDWGNARLIAAAPDMYDALQLALIIFESNGPRLAAASIRAAIKKAEGL